MTPAVLQARMAEQGVAVSRDTARRAIASMKNTAPASLATEAADVVAAAETAIESGQIGALTRRATEVDAALDEWAPLMGRNPTGARTYATLCRVRGDLARVIESITPRADAERAHLEELGFKAREELRARARAVAVRDDVTALKLEVASLRTSLARLLDERSPAR